MSCENTGCRTGCMDPMNCAKSSGDGGSPQSACSVESATRQVIEGKLLTALDDDSKVAILASEDDLNVMIRRLATGDETERNLAADFVQLRRAAFPPNKEIRATHQMPTKSK